MAIDGKGLVKIWNSVRVNRENLSQVLNALERSGTIFTILPVASPFDDKETWFMIVSYKSEIKDV